MATYSTGQIAAKLDVHKLTILRWLQNRLLPEPRHIREGGQDIRVWTDADLARARRFCEANYRKARRPGRGRKAKLKRPTRRGR